MKKAAIIIFAAIVVSSIMDWFYYDSFSFFRSLTGSLVCWVIPYTIYDVYQKFRRNNSVKQLYVFLFGVLFSLFAFFVDSDDKGEYVVSGAVFCGIFGGSFIYVLFKLVIWLNKIIRDKVLKASS